MTRRHDLTDGQWAALEPLLSAPSGRGRPLKWSRRQLIDGIRWRIRTGAPWRDVPELYAPWSTVYGRFRRWQCDGTWAKILAALQAHADAAGKIGWTASVDSTINRAHQSTALCWVRRAANHRAGERAEPGARRSRWKSCSRSLADGSSGEGSGYKGATCSPGRRAWRRPVTPTGLTGRRCRTGKKIDPCRQGHMACRVNCSTL
ncbi:transposase [Nonomuraea recticatena]|uniref:transposase n=1 Tax=Nonomuraea recticatena TaxID=46178 RepID=UPI00360D66C0